MTYLKQHKELVLIAVVALMLGIAGFDLFSEQQHNSELLNSGTRIDPATISGRAACEVPIPDISKRSQSEPATFKTKEISN
jgi:hypothetical protein